MSIRTSGVGIFGIAAIVAISALVIFTAGARAAELHVGSGQPYATIQAAVNAANPVGGDMIIVHNGTYTENVDVNKSLTIRSLNGSANCFVYASNPNDHVFNVTADWVNISRFTVQNATAGIYLTNSDHCTISENNASNNSNGIYLYSSNNNTLTGNTVNSNKHSGIYLSSSSNNVLTGNTANSNSVSGIYLSSSSNNTIANNTMVGDGIRIYGHQLQHWNTHFIDISNTVNGKPVYYWKDQTGGTVPSGAGQVILANCTNVVVENLNVSDGSAGISLGFSSSNTITNNAASNNTYGDGIYLYSSNNNTLTGNTASNNADGIWLDSSCNNTLTGNTAADNSNYGIVLVDSSNNILMGNTASNNRDTGISLSYADYCTINHNHILDNGVDGIYIWRSKDIVLVNNEITFNKNRGIQAWYLNSSTIFKNSVKSNVFNGIHLIYSANNSVDSNDVISNKEAGIYLPYSSNNFIYRNNFVNNDQNAALHNSTNTWNSPEELNYTYEGNVYINYLGNYWDDYTGSDADGDGIGDAPYSIGSDADNYPFMVPFENYLGQAENIFDTNHGDYPSLSGTHNGTLTTFYDINISRMYTYSCLGTGGHTEYAAILHSNGTVLAEAHWNGYTGDWHNLTFNNSFTLYANETYNYTIRTGSYPQIIHEPSWNATGGKITCEEFVDLNGKRHEGWIPAIRLSQD
jgi:parallel beta-helix repeat protein